MRKIFTLILVAMTAVAVRATDYNVPVTVTVNGISTEQRAVITVVENGGLYDITLKNFMLKSADSTIGVGNVELKGIEPTQDGNATLLMAAKQVMITNGDDPNVPMWMASLLPPVNVLLRGKIEGDHLRCFLDIDLMDTLGQIVEVAIGGGYQLQNQSFELWHTSTGDYVEPNGWHSFESASGSLAAMAGHHIAKSTDAHSGMASARIFATSLFGIVANGTMTTGRLNAGSMMAADAANHAYLDMSKTDTDGNGDPFYTPLYTRPDSLVLWVKFSQGRSNNSHPYATVSAVVTDGTYYQDPEDKSYSNVVAKAGNSQIATTGGQWARISASFVYTANGVEPQAVLLTVSTNADAGQGSENDEVLVDDIALVYNAKLNSLKIKGQDVPGFSADVNTYEMQIDETITADDIEATADGQATHVIKHVEAADGYYLCTVTAIGADMSTTTTYAVSVKSAASSISTISTAAAAKADYYTLDGCRAETLVPGRIYICHQADGSVKKVRR